LGKAYTYLRSMSKEEAQAAKNRGNTAFSKNEFEVAVSEFSRAIELDPTDHVFYSNRSGAYANLKQYEKALCDAEECIKLKPGWSKGYSRKGHALVQLEKLEEAKAAYDEGLAAEPENGACVQGLKDVEAKKKSPLGKLFGADMWGRLAADPTTRGYLEDPAILAKIRGLQTNPDNFNGLFGGGGDPRMSHILSVILGMGAGMPPRREEERPKTKASDEKKGETGDKKQKAEKPAEKSTEAEKTEKPTEKAQKMKTEKRETKAADEPDDRDEPFYEDEVDPELEEEKRKRKQASDFKEKGNAHYKNKDFGKALEMYDKALELDPDNITVQNNKAAVFFEEKIRRMRKTVFGGCAKSFAEKGI